MIYKDHVLAPTRCRLNHSARILRLAAWAVIAIAPASFAEERALWARGSWHAAGTGDAKTWSASLQVGDDGTVGGSATIGQPYDPCVVVGTVIDDRLSLNLRGEREGVVAEWLLEATISGTRLVGELEAPDGSAGKWDGWWQPVLIETHEPRVLASHVTGRRGGAAWFTVALDSGWKSIAGVQNDISVDGQVQIADCVADDMLPKEVFYAHREGGLRAIVLSLTDTDAIGTAVLYRCQATIDATATLGIHVLRVFGVAGSDTDGNAKSIQPVDGAIEVVAADAVGFDALPRLAWETNGGPPGGSIGESSAAGDGGCAVDPNSRSPWMLLLILAALCGARLSSRRL